MSREQRKLNMFKTNTSQIRHILFSKYTPYRPTFTSQDKVK